MQIFMKKILPAGVAVAIIVGLLSMVGCENEVKLEPIQDEPKKEQAGDKDSTAGTNGTKTGTGGTSSPAANNSGSAADGGAVSEGMGRLLLTLENAGDDAFGGVSLSFNGSLGNEGGIGYEWASNAVGTAYQQMTGADYVQVSPGSWTFTLEARKDGQLVGVAKRSGFEVKVGDNQLAFVLVPVSSATGGSNGAGSTSFPENSDLVVFNGPAFYSSKDRGLVTPVKSQGKYGTCWAHAAASVIETAMIKKKLATPDSVDLSEVFLVYYYYNTEPTPIGGMEKDRRWSDTAVWPMLRDGGQPGDLINVVCAWAGVVDQKKSYPIMSESDMEYNMSYINSIRQEAYQNQEVLVTSAGKINTYSGGEPNDPTMVSAINRIKQAIYDYGSVTTNYNSTCYYTSDYDDISGGQYCGVPMNQTHAITLVGWDDNFNDFGRTPAPAPGAWLVRNSYGDDWGKNGYCWLSYYDKTIGPGAVYFDVTARSEYDNNYQYDGARTVDESIATGAATVIQAANVYKARGREELRAVQFGMAYDGMKYDIDIYRVTNPQDPASGERVATVSGSQLPAGRHTITLPTAVQLEQGDTFSVVVTYTGLNGKTPTAEYEAAKNSNPQESFFRLGTSGDWKDMYYHTDDDGKMQCGNLRLKAFTKNLP